MEAGQPICRLLALARCGSLSGSRGLPEVAELVLTLLTLRCRAWQPPHLGKLRPHENVFSRGATVADAQVRQRPARPPVDKWRVHGGTGVVRLRLTSELEQQHSKSCSVIKSRHLWSCATQ